MTIKHALTVQAGNVLNFFLHFHRHGAFSLSAAEVKGKKQLF
jgi:hypothetical protein